MLINQPIDLNAFLSSIEPYSALDASTFARLVAAARVVRVERGTVLFEQGQPCAGVYVMFSGQIKLAFCSPHGAEKIISVAQARQSVGEECVTLERNYPFNGEVLVDSTLVFLPRHVLVECLEKSQHFVQRLMARIAENFHNLLVDMEASALLSGTERVVEFLVRQLDERVASGPAVVELTMAKSIIASRLSLTQEHFSRLLRQLSDTGLIAVEGRQIHIADVRRLRQYLNSGAGHGVNRPGRSSGRGRASLAPLAVAC